MQRHDYGISRGAGVRNKREELRCRNRAHISNFLSSSTFEQGKKANGPILMRRGDAASSPSDASPETNRLPLILGFRIFEPMLRGFILLNRALNASYRLAIFTLS